MNEIKIRYVLDNGNVIEKRILDYHKLHYIDINLLALFQAPIDTDYIKSIVIKINKDVK
jgi:hypothetical protein